MRRLQHTFEHSRKWQPYLLNGKGWNLQWLLFCRFRHTCCCFCTCWLFCHWYPCNLCKLGQIGINIDIVFNGNDAKCADVYTFLVDKFKEGSDTSVSAQSSLSDNYCQDPGTLQTGECAVFSDFDASSDGKSGKVPAQGSKIMPPMDFASIKSRGNANASLTNLCIGTVSVVSMGLFLLSCL